MRRALALSPVVARATTSGSTGAAAASAARYLVSRQQSSGGFFSASATADGVAEVIASLAAAGGDRAPIERALAYVRANGESRARERGAYAGRIVMGIVAAGENPRAFGGANYVAILDSFYDSVSGRADDGIYADALAKLGMLAARETLPAQALTYLRVNECTGGGFGHETGCVGGADTDTTAAVLSVFVAAGAREDAVVGRACDWLRSVQNSDGGFGSEADTASNANSTGLVLSAVAAQGESSSSWRTPRGHDPLDALMALQLSSGAFRFTAAESSANDYATVQAVPGVLGVAYPIRPGARQHTRATASSVSPASRARASSAVPAVSESRETLDARAAQRARVSKSRARAGEAVAMRARSGRSPAPSRRSDRVAIVMIVLGCAAASGGLVARRGLGRRFRRGFGRT